MRTVLPAAAGLVLAGASIASAFDIRELDVRQPKELSTECKSLVLAYPPDRDSGKGLSDDPKIRECQLQAAWNAYWKLKASGYSAEPKGELGKILVGPSSRQP